MTEPTLELDERFSSEEATPRPWPEVESVLEEAEMFWLSTVRRDGRPHVTPLPAMWLNGALHFCTGPNEQKARNIESNPQCVLTTGCNKFLSGLDVVVEGRARRVTDASLLISLAAMWESKLHWTFEVVDGGFRDSEVAGEESGAPVGSVGAEGGGDRDRTRHSGAAGSRGATAYVYAVAPVKVLAFGKGEPFSQSRYRF